MAIHAVQLAVSHPDSEAPETAGSTCIETENPRLASSQDTGLVNSNYSALIQAKTVNITSDYQVYPAYTASPATEGNYPAIVLIHSFKGFEPRYQTTVNKMADDGYVVIAPFWQTHDTSPSDAEVEALIRNSITYLETRDDVDIERIGLTGFCAGGRYTMLFLSQIKEFESGVAWYGFPYTGGSKSSQTDRPV